MSPDLSGVERGQIIQQIAYLAQSPAFRAAWQTVVDSPTDFTLNRDRSEDHLGNFDPVKKEINFDLDEGFENNGNCELPVQITIHEVGHAADFARLGPLKFEDLFKKPDGFSAYSPPYAPNAGEYSAMMFERSVSKELGLFSTMNYGLDPNNIQHLMPYLPGK